MPLAEINPYSLRMQYLTDFFCQTYRGRLLLSTGNNMPNLAPIFKKRKQSTGWNDWNRFKGNSNARGYGSRWRKLRQAILDRDYHLCQLCKANGRLSEANHVDHIRSKATGGTDAPSNLQALCEPCHKHKTATERR